VRVAACQVELDVADPDRNRARLDAAVSEAAAAGARLVVLPELGPSGYAFADAAEVRERAEPADGPSVSQWCQQSAELDVVVVAGFAERGTDGEIYNSAAVCERGELRAIYRKAHLWDREKEFFRPGDAAPPVLDTSVGRLAVMICYDLEFPEWVRMVALRGAQILAVPTNWPLLPRPADERAGEVVRAQAAAATNGIFVVAADRCGPERGVEWVGGTAVLGTDGYPLAGLGDPARPVVAAVDVDPGAADDKRISARNDVLADRRIDLYRL
jgi:predicted amidohydrolase